MKKRNIFFLTIAMIILAIVLVFVFRKDNTYTREQVVEILKTPDSHFYDWNGINVHYTLQGDTGEVILLVHGLTGSTNNFKDFSQKLKENYRVYSIDLPAFGLTEVPDIASLKTKDLVAYHQQFILGFLDEVGVDSCHIVGNSLGGLVSWGAVVADQDRFMSLTLLNSAGYELDKVKSNITGGVNSYLLKKILGKGSPAYINKKVIERTFYRDELITDEGIMTAHYTNNKKGTLDWMGFLVSSNIVPDTAAIKTIEVPTLIVWGQQDEIINVNHAFKFERDLPNSNLIIYDETGHLPMIEQVDKLTQDWKAFEHDL